jgi:thioredoxin 1
MKNLNSQEEFDSFIKENNLALVDFYAEWCGPCKRIAPELEIMAESMTSISFAKVNIDNVPVLAEFFRIRSVPTMILFKAGDENQRIIGAPHPVHIRDKLIEFSR